jgi:hypothetical protein
MIRRIGRGKRYKGQDRERNMEDGGGIERK